MNETFKQSVAAIHKVFPDTTPIVFAVAKAKKNREAYDAIRFVLNYYEFIAVAIEHEDLGERVMRDCIGSVMCLFCRRAEDFIVCIRDEDQYGNSAPEKARLLKSLRLLQSRWQDTLIAMRQK